VSCELNFGKILGNVRFFSRKVGDGDGPCSVFPLYYIFVYVITLPKKGSSYLTCVIVFFVGLYALIMKKTYERILMMGVLWLKEQSITF